MKNNNIHARMAAYPAILAAALVLSSSMAGCLSKSDSKPEPTVPGAGTGLLGAGKGPSPVVLGKSGEYVILAKAGISNTGATAVTGNIGVSPVAASFITGFSLVSPPSAYSTSSLITGQVFASDYASPTPANLTTGVLDMLTAFTDAAGRAPDYTELGAGEIGGRTLAPATYKWGTDLLITTDVTLSGGPNDVWIFQVAGNLTLSSGVKVILSGGASAKNIFWQVAGAASHGTTTHFEGVELSKTAITLKTGASSNGRLLAQTAVALDANAVSAPAP
ncbi:MAG: ice-binding family protein [Fibrobacteria bacterium]